MKLEFRTSIPYPCTLACDRSRPNAQSVSNIRTRNRTLKVLRVVPGAAGHATRGSLVRKTPSAICSSEGCLRHQHSRLGSGFPRRARQSGIAAHYRGARLARNLQALFSMSCSASLARKFSRDAEELAHVAVFLSDLAVFVKRRRRLRIVTVRSCLCLEAAPIHASWIRSVQGARKPGPR